jgi:hypothetical protein
MDLGNVQGLTPFTKVEEIAPIYMPPPNLMRTCSRVPYCGIEWAILHSCLQTTSGIEVDYLKPFDIEEIRVTTFEAPPKSCTLAYNDEPCNKFIQGDCRKELLQ